MKKYKVFGYTDSPTPVRLVNPSGYVVEQKPNPMSNHFSFEVLSESDNFDVVLDGELVGQLQIIEVSEENNG